MPDSDAPQSIPPDNPLQEAVVQFVQAQAEHLRVTDGIVSGLDEICGRMDGISKGIAKAFQDIERRDTDRLAQGRGLADAVDGVDKNVKQLMEMVEGLSGTVRKLDARLNVLEADKQRTNGNPLPQA